MARSKIIFAGETLMDLTGDTIDETKLLRGVTAHGPNGEAMVGICDFDVDSSPATAGEEVILAGRTAAVGGRMITGTMPDCGAVMGVISARDGQYAIPRGRHDGNGRVSLEAGERAKLVPGNIRRGVTILAVEGSLSAEGGGFPQEKTVIPGKEMQILLPDAGYDCLSQVVVMGIPCTRTANAAGGMTVIIG